MKKKNWELGETVCYPHDYGFRHLMDIPVKFAIAWTQEILPESTLGFSDKAKEIDIDKFQADREEQNKWLNKLLIVIDIPHPGEIVGLYKHDGKFSIQVLRYG